MQQYRASTCSNTKPGKNNTELRKNDIKLSKSGAIELVISNIIDLVKNTNIE